MLWGSDLLVTGTALTLVSAISLGGTMWFYAGGEPALVRVRVGCWCRRRAGASLEDIEGVRSADGSFRPARGATAIVHREGLESARREIAETGAGVVLVKTT